jgi:hypothetical protein
MTPNGAFWSSQTVRLVDLEDTERKKSNTIRACPDYMVTEIGLKLGSERKYYCHQSAIIVDVLVFLLFRYPNTVTQATQSGGFCRKSALT